VAIRYSAVRRQGFAEDGKSEVQVLDYTQQQHRLFPLLASAYCFHFTGHKVLEKLKDIEERFLSEKPVSKAEITDIHASSSALKSFTTTVAADGIEDCRKACGGHGYLQSSGLPELSTTYLMNPTVEGDNQMLPQQVVKVLLKLEQAIHAGDDLTDYAKCDSADLITPIQSILAGGQEKFPPRSAEDVLDLELLLGAFRHRAARLLVECAGSLQQGSMNDKSPQDAWNKNLIQMARVSRAYSQYLLLVNFVHGIEDSRQRLGISEKTVLSDLARLFGLYWMEREMGDFFEDGYLSRRQAKWVREKVLALLNIVRPNAVALVDAFDYSDFILKSALGRYDGNVYPAIMAASEKDPLNKQEIGPGYEEHLKRLISGGAGVYTGTASRL
jgi:acyl-CoA oxidase